MEFILKTLLELKQYRHLMPFNCLYSTTQGKKIASLYINFDKTDTISNI